MPEVKLGFDGDDGGGGGFAPRLLVLMMMCSSCSIHVASRRQPPAPHRWAHTAGDCRKKKCEEFDSHV